MDVGLISVGLSGGGGGGVGELWRLVSTLVLVLYLVVACIIKNLTRLTWKVKFDDNFNERR